MTRRNKRHASRFERLALGGHIGDAHFFLQDLLLAYLENGVKYMDDDIVYLPKLYDICKELRETIKDDVDKIKRREKKELQYNNSRKEKDAGSNPVSDQRAADSRKV